MTSVMPKMSGGHVSSWAEASAGVGEKKNLRTMTTEVEENDKRYKVTTTYNVTTKKVPRVVAERKKWKKFGASANDGPGPNISTTFASEEIPLQFAQNQLEQELADERKNDALRGETSTGRCRYCKVDGHWSHRQEWILIKQLQDVYNIQDDKLNDAPRNQGSANPGAYVPPNARERNTGLTERRNDENTCRVTNLPEDMPDLEEQLRDMFGQIGRIDRFYLARDKNTNRLRGFAFITYEKKEHTERAIATFNNAKFGHLILKVEWTKPSN